MGRGLLLTASGVLFFGGALAGVLLGDHPGPESVAFLASGVGLLMIFVLSAEARANLADRFGWLSGIASAIVRLRRRVVLALLAACIAGLVVAEVWERALYPRGHVAAYVAETYDALSAGVYEDPGRPPLLAAAALEEEFPADDQRYVPVGVLLRYERHVVAVLPGERGGSRLRVMDDGAGYRALYPYVGEAWGDAYGGDTGVPESVRWRPSDADAREAERLLAEATRAQDVCYGWRLDIRSGRGKGVFAGAPERERRCVRYVTLEGWIDPLEGRFTERGSPGDWEFTWDARPGPLSQEHVDAVSVTHMELLTGATTEPSGSGGRAGKGLLDHIAALPLLAQSMPDVPPVPLRRADGVPPGAEPHPAERTDSERRADASWVGLPPALLRVASIGGLLLVALLLPIGAVRWLLRRRRG